MAVPGIALALAIGIGIGFALYNLLQGNNTPHTHDNGFRSIPQKSIGTGKPRAEKSRKRTKRKQSKECIICTDLIGNWNKKTLKCGHTFHENCVARWLQEKNECPFRCSPF